jgi:hypothetical protein
MVAWNIANVRAGVRFPLPAPLFMKNLFYITLVVLSGCAGGGSMTLHPTNHTQVYSICEQYQRPGDKTEHIHCDKRNILSFKMTF